jgi:hypothetical protein
MRIPPRSKLNSTMKAGPRLSRRGGGRPPVTKVPTPERLRVLEAIDLLETSAVGPPIDLLECGRPIRELRR